MKKQFMALGLSGLIGLSGFGLLANKSFADTSVSGDVYKKETTKDTLEKGNTILDDGVYKKETTKDVVKE
ncbi:hypothetical protein [Clostridioides sp. ZZV15-6388]|uniref:hypothetical protein n=1 Tax=unclassified Clostridioides TaxID=2635829 RepID=UPI001D11BAAB|nr:hypothetical protein [Clostridioides sp. ZZV15-6388]MCC0662720.1 hypothetical protein [Clostridioides sp. ZZV15-6597]